MQFIKALFVLLFMLTLACNLSAQDVSPEKTDESKTVLADMLPEADEEPDSALGAGDSAGGDELTPAEEDEAGENEAGEDEAGEDEAGDDEEGDLGDDEEEQIGPVTISLNENGELVGQAIADVAGDWVPVEANVALVANGVLLNKIVADENGSFAFPNVAPGDYNVCGTASSYCGKQAVSVQCHGGGSVDFQDNVGLRLRQSEQGCCYSKLGSAPAATYTEGSSLGFSSGGGFAGSGSGGFATGGGAAGGVSGLRLLTIGGIATAIAVGSSDDDDDVSPSN